MGSRTTIKVARVCTFCQSLYSMWDLQNGHLCRFSTSHPTPHGWSHVAWSYLAMCAGGVVLILAIAILEGL